jgi:hypothetical protein
MKKIQVLHYVLSIYIFLTKNLIVDGGSLASDAVSAEDEHSNEHEYK